MNNNEGLCECNCGQPAPIAKYTVPRMGWIKGQPKKFIHGHNARGKICSFETKEKIRIAHTGAIHSLEYRKSQSKAASGNEPIFSPFLPGDVFVNYLKKGKRWCCHVNGINSYHALAVYKHFKGLPPPGYHVHHINGNASQLESDHPDNLIAIPKIWNFTYLPVIAKGFNVPESRVTKAYIKLVDKTSPDQLFKEICLHLCQET